MRGTPIYFKTFKMRTKIYKSRRGLDSVLVQYNVHTYIYRYLHRCTNAHILIRISAVAPILHRFAPLHQLKTMSYE